MILRSQNRVLKHKQSLILAKARKKVFVAFGFVVIVSFLVLGGWVVRNNFFHKLKTLGVSSNRMVKPVASEGIKLQVERALKQLALKENLSLVGQPEIRGDTLMATFSGQLTCFLSLDKKMASQLTSLQFILWRSKIDGRRLKTVDLRFDKPVVEY